MALPFSTWKAMNFEKAPKSRKQCKLNSVFSKKAWMKPRYNRMDELMFFQVADESLLFALSNWRGLLHQVWKAAS